MIVFKTITIQNFLSYGANETTIDLNCESPTLITGINYDASVNGELDSNGCGKSSILNALSYVLYNKAISITENLDSLINNVNQKDMLVTLTFTKNKAEYKISRFRKNKPMGGNGVLIEQRKGKSWKDITSTKPEDQIANSILQIPFTVFNRIIGYAAGEEPFLKMGLPKQREVIDELFEYTELTKKADKIKELVKGLKKDLEYARESNESIKQEARRHREQYDSMVDQSKQWESSKEESLERMEATIFDLSAVDYKEQKELLTQVSKLRETISEISLKRKDAIKELRQAEEEQLKFENFDTDKEKKIETAKRTLAEGTIEKFSEEEQMELLSTTKKLNKEISELSSNLITFTQKEKRLKKIVDELQGELSHLDDAKCPYCLQKYEDAKAKITEVKENLKENNDLLVDITSQISDMEKQKDGIEKNLKKVESKLIFSNESDIVNYTNNIERLAEKIKSLNNQDNPYEDRSNDIKTLLQKVGELDEVEREYFGEYERECTGLVFDNESELATSLSKLESLKERLQEKREEQNPYTDIINQLDEYRPKENKNKEIEELEHKILHCDFLIKLLTKKDSYLRKALMDKYLPMLNKRLHHYLTLMALPHKVVFNSDLTTGISQFGQSIPYGNLSAGQRARINIALSLSFRDVLQSKHNFINLFILDECLDVGLSNVGVRKTVKAIKEVAKTNKLSMFVISHRDEAKESFPEKLEIELRNGFSSIKKGV